MGKLTPTAQALDIFHGIEHLAAFGACLWRLLCKVLWLVKYGLTIITAPFGRNIRLRLRASVPRPG